MSEEIKKKKKAAIIAGIVGATALISGATGGIIVGTETEAKTEESEGEEENKKNPTGGSVGKQTTTKPIDKKNELATALPSEQRALGTIATNGATLTVDMIKAKLPANIKDHVDIQIKPNGTSATVTAKSDSTDYKGTVEVTFTVDKKNELATALPSEQRALGTIATNGATLTVDMIKAKLPANIKDHVDIQIKPNGTSATVTAKSDSTDYKGTVEVTFTVDKKNELATALPSEQRALGTIATNGATLTVDMIKAKLPANIKDHVDIQIKPNGTSATVTAKSDSTDYKGTVEVTFTVDKKNELATALPSEQRALGTIATNGATLTVDMIKAKLPANIKDHVDIQIKPNGTSATVTAKSDSTDYKGTVEVTFTVDKKNELATALPSEQRALGTIATNGATLTVDMIKAKLPANIKDHVDIQIKPNGTSATVTAKSDSTDYKGTVEVTFTVDKKNELATALPSEQRALGTIATNGATLTVDMIKAKLPANIKDHVDIQIKPNGTSATVTAKSDSTDYKGTVEVTFTVDKKNELNHIKGDAIWSLAIGSDGSVYAGTRSGKIYKNENEIRNLNNPIWSLAIGSDGSVYAGTRSGKIYKNENEIRNIKEQVTSLAIGSDGSVYAGTRSGKIYKNENEIRNLNIAIREIIIKANGDVYLVTINGKIYNKNGQEIYDLGFSITSSTTNTNNSVYVGNNQGKIYKIDITQSRVMKTEIYTIASSNVTSLAIGSDGSVYAGDSIGKIYKVGIV